jgi:hypothetical protein
MVLPPADKSGRLDRKSRFWAYYHSLPRQTSESRSTILQLEYCSRHCQG